MMVIKNSFQRKKRESDDMFSVCVGSAWACVRRNFAMSVVVLVRVEVSDCLVAVGCRKLGEDVCGSQIVLTIVAFYTFS